MSVSSISSSDSLSQTLQAWQAKAQTIQSEFQKLGQDLQAGSLTQAQSDFTSLSQNLSGSGQGNGTLAQAFSALGSALQSGGVAAAQKAYAALQQDVQQAGGGHHHHHGGGIPQSSNSSTNSTLSQLFASLGSAIQSGDLSAAQTAYATLQQDVQQLSGSVVAGSQSPAGAVSLIG